MYLSLTAAIPTLDIKITKFGAANKAIRKPTSFPHSPILKEVKIPIMQIMITNQNKTLK